ncbi:MAG: gephyrin-like molybdotransferase Glp [Terracidiphilus sp.]
MSAGLLSYNEAATLVTAFTANLDAGQRTVERVVLARAQSRVLARALSADQDQPPFARSTRDGFACRAAEASSYMFLRVAGATHAGQAPSGPLPANAAWEIMTGAPVPSGADAVVMLEHVEKDADMSGAHMRLLPPRTIDAGDNIVARGAQAKKGDVLLPAGSRLGPAQIALAATCGYASLDVYTRPRVAILTTGDELVPVDWEPGPGQIRNSNAPMLAALVADAGGEPWVLPAAADRDDALDNALREAIEADLLLISGGVSAGKFDLVEPALARIGARFHFTGVRIQPGKPLVFGEVQRSRLGSRAETGARVLPFLGLPGNPVSSAVTFLLFAAPVLAALAGEGGSGPRFALAQLAEDTDRRTKPGLTRFLPASCDFNPSTAQFPQVETVQWQGSGDLAAFARSNCFLVVPEDAGSLEAGAMVRILMI